MKSFNKIHRAVKLNYLGRLIIYTVEMLLSFSVFYSHNEPIGYWVTIASIYIVWPTTAFLVSVNSRNQIASEIRNMIFESFLIGFYFSFLKFDLWACIAFSSINLLFFTMIGGPVFFLKSLCIALTTGFLSTIFITGFVVLPASSLLTIIISCTLILVSIAVMGLSSFYINKLLSSNRKNLKIKQDQIISSLMYARTIQNSLMSNIQAIQKELPSSFVIWDPRDIVGGDIYFTNFSEDEFVISVIDCTGHGVPGALLSMLASSVLQRIVRYENINNPAKILKRLNTSVRMTLYQEANESMIDDGMDIGICVVNKKEKTLVFSGARIPLLVIRNGESEIIKGDKQSIGYKGSSSEFTFTNHRIPIDSSMSFYLFSDGITSQTGGEKGIMFGTKRLKGLLEASSSQTFEEQKNHIINKFQNYSQKTTRKDDITLIGFSLDEVN